MDASNLNSKEGFGWAYKIALLCILAIVAFYLIEEHRAHLIAYSGTILFVIFILLHLFMHSGHGGHGGHGDHGGSDGAHHEHDSGREEMPEADKAGEPIDAHQHENRQVENKL